MKFILANKPIMIKEFSKGDKPVINQYQEYLIWDEFSCCILYRQIIKYGDLAICYLKGKDNEHY